MTTSEAGMNNYTSAEKRDLDKRLQAVAWACFLIMVGGVGLVPARFVPEGTWLIGAGLIMLCLNAARYVNDIKMSTGTIVLGTCAFVIGVSGFLGVDLPFFPILLILLGCNLLLQNVLERSRAH